MSKKYNVGINQENYFQFSCGFSFSVPKDVKIPGSLKNLLNLHPSPSTQGFIGSGVFKKLENVMGEQFDWQN